MKKHKFGAQIKNGKLILKNKFAFENTVKEIVMKKFLNNYFSIKGIVHFAPD